MAEGAPLLREYAVNPASRVRIPPSPPLQIKKPQLRDWGFFICNGFVPAGRSGQIPAVGSLSNKASYTVLTITLP